MIRIIKSNKKTTKRPIYCGISGKYNEQKNKYDFTVDFEKNTSDDVIQFIKPYFYESNIDGYVYWFGYKFNGKLDKEYRDAFIDYLKGIQLSPMLDDDNEFDDIDYSEDYLNEIDLEGMIGRSLNSIPISKYSIDTVVYPQSATNDLVKGIVRCISRMLRTYDVVDYVEIKKCDPRNITININQCLRDKELTNQIPDFVDKEYLERLQKNINSLKSFSLRKDVKPKVIRDYISDFLEISDICTAIDDANNILIIDDFKTSGTTIREMIRIIHKHNPDCSVYVFTLIGKK